MCKDTTFFIELCVKIDTFNYLCAKFNVSIIFSCIHGKNVVPLYSILIAAVVESVDTKDLKSFGQ